MLNLSLVDKAILSDVMTATKLMKEERKLSSLNLALVLVHDLLLAKGIQAGDGPIKQAILRHKTRLHGEFQKLKIKRGVTSNAQLAQSADERAGTFPRFIPSGINYIEDETSQYTSLRSSQHLIVDNRRCSPAFPISRIRVRQSVGGQVTYPITYVIGPVPDHINALQQGFRERRPYSGTVGIRTPNFLR